MRLYILRKKRVASVARGKPENCIGTIGVQLLCFHVSTLFPVWMEDTGKFNR